MVTKHLNRMLSWRNLVFSPVIYISCCLSTALSTSLPLNIKQVLTAFFRVFDTSESLLSYINVRLHYGTAVVRRNSFEIPKRNVV